MAGAQHTDLTPLPEGARPEGARRRALGRRALGRRRARPEGGSAGGRLSARAGARPEGAPHPRGAGALLKPRGVRRASDAGSGVKGGVKVKALGGGDGGASSDAEPLGGGDGRGCRRVTAGALDGSKRCGPSDGGGGGGGGGGREAAAAEARAEEVRAQEVRADAALADEVEAELAVSEARRRAAERVLVRRQGASSRSS